MAEPSSLVEAFRQSDEDFCCVQKGLKSLPPWFGQSLVSAD